MENIDDIRDAGAVVVLYGLNSGLTASDDDFWSQNSDGISCGIEENNRFAWSPATGAFDGDNRDDLAIGVSLEDTNDTADPGPVNVIYGTSSGLDSSDDQIWYQDLESLEDGGEYRDRYGFSLTIGDVDGDGRHDLAVEIPYENDRDTRDSGAVGVMYGAASGLAGAGDEIWHREVAGMEGDVEHRDQFGFSVAGGNFNNDGRNDLVIGIPKQAVGNVEDAGSVHVIYGSRVGLTS